MSNPQTPYIKDSEQAILNKSFDPTFDVLAVENLAYNGSSLVRVSSKDVAAKITVSGTTTYVAKAAVGSAESAASWQAKKITVSGSDTTITWADGNTNYDNIATDLTALSYS